MDPYLPRRSGHSSLTNFQVGFNYPGFVESNCSTLPTAVFLLFFSIFSPSAFRNSWIYCIVIIIFQHFGIQICLTYYSINIEKIDSGGIFLVPTAMKVKKIWNKFTSDPNSVWHLPSILIEGIDSSASRKKTVIQILDFFLDKGKM